MMQIIFDRRALHRIPELDRDLPKTTEYVKNALSRLKCRIFSPIDGAVCAFFDFGKERTIAFRADMDALPIQEKSTHGFVSCHPGKMHACGHDGHMAILLELARRLNGKKDLPHNVLLVLQPAEETTGGARDICQSGVFEEYGVTAIFGLHLWPGLTAGQIFSRETELMSRSCEINVEIRGKSAHIARAADGLDAMAACVEFYRQAMDMERGLPDSVFRLLKFGKMECGTVRNAIAGSARLEGSLRAFQDDIFDALRGGLDAIATRVQKATGCAVSVSANEGYPAVMNPGELYDRVKKCVDFWELDSPSMTAEDFSYYQKRLPGMFFFLGTGNSPALHADTFDFDESILAKGADFFENLAENF